MNKFEENLVQMLVQNYLSDYTFYHNNIVNDEIDVRAVLETFRMEKNINGLNYIAFIQILRENTKTLPFNVIQQLIFKNDNIPFMYPKPIHFKIMFVIMEGCHYDTKNYEKRINQLLKLDPHLLASELSKPDYGSLDMITALDLIILQITLGKTEPVDDEKMKIIIDNFKNISINAVPLSELSSRKLSEPLLRASISIFDDWMN